MRKVILIIASALLLFACKTDKKQEQKKEVAKIVIKGEQILKEYIEPQIIYVVDSLLLTKNNPTAKKLFSVFNKNGKLLTSFGRVGQGPNDFGAMVMYYNQVTYNKAGDICIWLYEMNYKRMRKINLSKTVKEKTVIIEQTIPILPSLNFMSPYYINSDLIVGNINNMDLHMDKLRFYNPISRKVEKRVPLLPKVQLETKDAATILTEYNSLFVNALGYQPEKGFVSVFANINRMDFLNLKGEITKTILDNTLDDKITYELSDFPKDAERVVHNFFMTTTSNYIITIYNGVDSYKNIDWKNNVIRVFDWNGEEKFSLKPTESLMFIAYDEANAILYGITDEFDIFKYDLKDIFKKL